MHPRHAFGHRRAGVLLHVSSLPGAGTLGDGAYRFVDFLAGAGFSVWQVLPVLPAGACGSPYQPLSLFAGNPGLIDRPAMRREFALPDATGDDRALFGATLQRLDDGALPRLASAFADFRARNADWLEAYALFAALRERFGGAPWTRWPAACRDPDAEHAAEMRASAGPGYRLALLSQFVFERQWQTLKEYANDRGVLLFGDLPFYAGRDSADVWHAREQFRVDAAGHPTVVGGVPPDGFSDEGQRWDCPVYDWERMERDGFAWWLRRIERQSALFDILSIDHFRGLESYWAIPPDSADARAGQWLRAPGEALLRQLEARLGPQALVAEDLGTITEEVTALRSAFGLPGMRVLQFAFDGNADNPHLPANHEPDMVVYTGTHDNDTSLGWWQGLDGASQERARQLMGDDTAMPWPLIRLALASVATMAILPMQDLLALGSEARMNRPGLLSDENWSWRMPDATDLDALAARTAPLLRDSGRAPG